MLKSKLPESPALYPEDTLTNRTERFIASEMIREKVFTSYGQEVTMFTLSKAQQDKSQTEAAPMDGMVLTKAPISMEGKAVSTGPPATVMNLDGVSRSKASSKAPYTSVVQLKKRKKKIKQEDKVEEKDGVKQQNPNCPGKHGLTEFTTLNPDWWCSTCFERTKEKKALPVGSKMYGCGKCDYDICSACHDVWQRKNPNCPGKHGLTEFTTLNPNWWCSTCFERTKEKKALPVRSTMYGCGKCDYDICSACHDAWQRKNAAIKIQSTYRKRKAKKVVQEKKRNTLAAEQEKTMDVVTKTVTSENSKSEPRGIPVNLLAFLVFSFLMGGAVVIDTFNFSTELEHTGRDQGLLAIPKAVWEIENEHHFNEEQQRLKDLWLVDLQQRIQISITDQYGRRGQRLLAMLKAVWENQNEQHNNEEQQRLTDEGWAQSGTADLWLVNLQRRIQRSIKDQVDKQKRIPLFLSCAVNRDDCAELLCDLLDLMVLDAATCNKSQAT